MSRFDELLQQVSEDFDVFDEAERQIIGAELYGAAADLQAQQTDLHLQQIQQQAFRQQFQAYDRALQSEIDADCNEILGYAAEYGIPGAAEQINAFRKTVADAEAQGFGGLQ